MGMRPPATKPKTLFRAEVLTLAAMALASFGCAATVHPPKETSMTTQASTNGSKIVKDFFAAFGRGDLDGVVASFHPRAEIIAVRAGSRGDGQLHGSYEGTDGARTFVTTLGALFQTQAFEVNAVVAESNVVFASGDFVHIVKSTGKPFRSSWALRCDIADDKIRHFRFFEDSAAYVEASTP
jgi:ketosteroid isomerase-like protein